MNNMRALDSLLRLIIATFLALYGCIHLVPYPEWHVIVRMGVAWLFAIIFLITALWNYNKYYDE